ncbi:MAG: PocR ligand-binding domain-containing protein [Clostridia bacterium]|nr:PocR ligand-binding domain-containing protein [Clostridia bacterium]
MPERSLLLKQLFEVGDLQKLQDKISFATEVALITVDFTGKPVSAHSGCNEFCKRVREDPALREFCQKCDSRGGLEAARISKPYIYLCHMGLVDFATPVTLQGTYVGAVMAGQIRLKNPEQALERVTNAYNETKLEGALLSLYKALPVMSLDRIDALSNMIFYMYNYVIKEASEKIDGKAFSDVASHELPAHKSAPTIQPAIKYINETFHKEIRLDDLASLCDVSPSYFSKLFKKVFKTNLSTYVNGMRIEAAKTLLARTNKPVGDISYEVGFEDCGYFIKIFKRFVGLTPNLYRESRREQILGE